MATNIPPHNLTEVVNAAIELVNNPQLAQKREASLAVVLKHVQGPDFPTGGFLYGKSGIAQAYKTGRGRFMMRAKVSTENMTK
jgi:DNA gyrase subunit A